MMTDKAEPELCEVCGEPIKPDEMRYGCERCARLFGPCCNSVKDSYCVECV